MSQRLGEVLLTAWMLANWAWGLLSTLTGVDSSDRTFHVAECFMYACIRDKVHAIIIASNLPAKTIENRNILAVTQIAISSSSRLGGNYD